MSDTSRLVYVSDEMPGIQRVRKGHGFAYRGSGGNWLKDPGTLARIRALAVPPAYTEVWICPMANGHLQATGRDARGRKQYRYHPEWAAARGSHKFERMRDFGSALPSLRARVSRDLAQANQPGAAPTRNLVLATLVRLLDATLARVGNDEYARHIGSFGLTTLRNPHARVQGSTFRLRFRGKSGVEHDITVQDRRLARVVRRCQELPGQELFQYLDDEGEVRRIGSDDLNAYIAAAADNRFTAKDFRTWHGSVIALDLTLRACQAPNPAPFDSKAVLNEVARRLRNTPAVCRKAYIHPRVLALWEELARGPVHGVRTGSAVDSLSRPPRAIRGLSVSEQRLLALLQRRQPRSVGKASSARARTG